MGTAELGVALGVVGNLLLALLMYLGKGIKDDIKANEQGIKTEERRVTILEMEVATLKAREANQNTRVTSLELMFQELKGDMREVKGDMHRVARWVDLQADPGRHRRATDMKEGD